MDARAWLGGCDMWLKASDCVTSLINLLHTTNSVLLIEHIFDSSLPAKPRFD